MTRIWLVVDVVYRELPLLCSGYEAIMGIAQIDDTKTLHVRDFKGRSQTAPAGNVDPLALSKAVLRKIARTKPQPVQVPYWAR